MTAGLLKLAVKAFGSVCPEVFCFYVQLFSIDIKQAKKTIVLASKP